MVNKNKNIPHNPPEPSRFSVPDDISGLIGEIESRRDERDKAIGLAYKRVEAVNTEQEKAAAQADLNRMLNAAGVYDSLYPLTEGQIPSPQENDGTTS